MGLKKGSPLIVAPQDAGLMLDGGKELDDDPIPVLRIGGDTNVEAEAVPVLEGSTVVGVVGVNHVRANF